MVGVSGIAQKQTLNPFETHTMLKDGVGMARSHQEKLKEIEQQV